MERYAAMALRTGPNKPNRHAGGSWRDGEPTSIVMPALLNIPRRAERNSGDAVRRTFVDLGAIATSMASAEHQVVFGRRGTGKTHALENLTESLRRKSRTVVSVDLRTIGSAGSYYLSGPDGVPTSVTRIIVDVLEAIHQQVLETSLRLIEDNHDVTGLVHALDALGETVCSVEVVGTIDVTTERSAADRNARSFSATLASAPSVGLLLNDEETRSYSHRRAESGVERYTLRFGPLVRSLRALVQSLPGETLWIILDEWSALPAPLQPLVADFIRRCLLPVPGVVVKIGAIFGRSQFCRYDNGVYVGIELGADMMQDVDLDEYLIGNAGNRRAEEFFMNLFTRHIAEYWRGEGQQIPSGEIRDALSAVIPDFTYLLMAGGGVPRDTINVAGVAAQHAGAAPMTVHEIGAAAHRWFLNDKESQVRSNRAARRVLEGLRAYAQRNHRRGFLLDRHYDAAAPEIQDLYDARIIHQIANGVGPGAKYVAYLIDFGLYADLISDADRARAWKDNWLSNWRDFDPTKSPEVRRALLTIEHLRKGQG